MYNESGLTPHGVSGLKLKTNPELYNELKSHPTRGEWIEINSLPCFSSRCKRLTPHGVSGLKCRKRRQSRKSFSVSPHTGWVDWNLNMCTNTTHGICLTPHGVSGLKFFWERDLRRKHMSHPTRGEWIEIFLDVTEIWSILVSPHTGWVDWNSIEHIALGTPSSLTPHGVSGLKSFCVV